MTEIMNLINYYPPKWFLEHKLSKNFLQHDKVPKFRIELIDPNTQIQKLNLKINPKYEIFIKRDDQTHRELQLQGNKLRKLEFLIADALSKNAKHILTAGALQSNHCRTVAGVSKLLNLNTHLVLKSNTNDSSKLNPNGNLLIDLLLDSKIYLVEDGASNLELEYKMKILAEKIKKDLNEDSYIIPVGGSTLVGMFGYLEQFNEMLFNQKIDEYIDDIVFTTGSGGTLSGLTFANYMTGNKFRLHAFCVCEDSEFFYNHLHKEFVELFGENTGVNTNDLVNIIECSKGLGYSKSTQDELNFITNFFSQTGILLDPVYVGKTMYGLINLLTDKKPTLEYAKEENAINFLNNLKGNRILFIHTGGQLGNFDVNKYSNNLIKANSNVFDCFQENLFSLNFS